MASSMTTQDKKWKAESDARALAEAKVIEKDPGRRKAAKTAASRMATEQEEEARAMRSVAKKPAKSTKSPARSRAGGRRSRKRR